MNHCGPLGDLFIYSVHVFYLLPQLVLHHTKVQLNVVCSSLLAQFSQISRGTK